MTLGPQKYHTFICPHSLIFAADFSLFTYFKFRTSTSSQKFCARNRGRQAILHPAVCPFSSPSLCFFFFFFGFGWGLRIFLPLQTLLGCSLSFFKMDYYPNFTPTLKRKAEAFCLSCKRIEKIVNRKRKSHKLLFSSHKQSYLSSFVKVKHLFIHRTSVMRIRTFHIGTLIYLHMNFILSLIILLPYFILLK